MNCKYINCNKTATHSRQLCKNHYVKVLKDGLQEQYPIIKGYIKCEWNNCQIMLKVQKNRNPLCHLHQNYEWKKNNPEKYKISRAKNHQKTKVTEKRKQQKRKAQRTYVTTTQHLMSLLNRTAKRKNKEVKITFDELDKFKLLSCSVCNKNLSTNTGLGLEMINKKGIYELSNIKRICGVCKLIKPKENFNIVTFSKSLLRRSWKKTPMALIAMNKAKEGSRYKCAHCNELFPQAKIDLDHIIPITKIEETATNDLNIFVQRLFCDESNLQVLCESCHEVKTGNENSKRHEYKKQQKNNYKD